ncbi:MAG: PhzF family phenazine biosynthesis protein [Bacteroidales bacterium]|jgi:PhzF family phenazine biosynthesis protein|nr:PhzF family phenazine biosynthesis protein [Bacteroidales bacterium]
MKHFPAYQIDAFTIGPFTGNPAAVCVLNEWLTDDIMQKIAMENNLSETAFIVPSGGEWLIRWFTPVTEVDLCGHATLASSYVILNILNPEKDKVSFSTLKLGSLTVRKKGDILELDLPADTLQECILPDLVRESMGKAPLEWFMGRSDYLLLYGTENDILDLNPDFRRLGRADGRGVIATAPGSDTDFVSRFFAPQAGIDEDPVTGSAHTTLTPFWSARLGKKSMRARQLSTRGGYLECTLSGDRTLIAGHALLYLKGEIFI